MRKLLSVLFSILQGGVRGGLLFVALLATTCLWADDFEVDGIYYNYLDGNNVEVTNNNSINAEKYSGEVIIPSTVTYKGTTYNVTSIGERAFSQCSSLTSVTIPNSVTSIGDCAFYRCSSLTSLTIPNSVTSIGNRTFSYCSALTSITIPNSVTSIGDWTFSYCSSLTSITIPNSVTSIGDWAFYSCSSLTSLTIPNSVTSIGNSTFSYCSALASITIPNSVTSIGDQAFDNCSSITSVTIPNSVESIGWRAFQSCISLISITIPNSVTTIGTYAFDGCSALTSMIVENGNTIYDSRENCNAIIETATNTLLLGCQNTIIPNSVTSIESGAFSRCSSLTSIIIPNSVTSIVNNPFEGCYGLSSIVVESGNHTYDSRENCNAIIETKSNTLIAGCQNTVIPNSVTSIGNYAFDGCSSLTSITIPNSVTSIGNYAFSGCSSLTSITIPNSVTSIGKLAFFNCTSLTSISLPNNLTNIGNRAFINTPWLQNQPEGLLYFGDILYTYVGAIPEDAEIVIKEGTTKIAGGAFTGGDHNNYTVGNITSFTFPQSIEFIGENAFSSSFIQDSLKINYLGNMEDWCDIVFENQYANPLNIRLVGPNEQTKLYINDSIITELVIPNTIDSIHDYTFYGYRALTSVTIPQNVKFIGKEAFLNCGIKNVYLQSITPPALSKKSWKNFSSNPVCYIPCGSQAEYAASDWAIQVEYFEEYYPYSLSIASSNEDWGTVEEPTCEGGILITATPKIGYQFVKWSDGNTDNPRKLELTQDTTLVAEFVQAYSGQCGDNLHWCYDETAKTISITGSGKMYDYTATTQPWLLFKEQLVEVTTTNTVTSIGTSAFKGCVRLAKISLGTGLEEIAANAFAGCTRLYDIYVYATYPPFADESSFANYNVYVYIPCEYQRDYTLDVVWGNFKFIECIESEDVTTDGVIITPSTNDVTITWPTEDNAENYTIVIEKDGEVFCTLTFNADGQLLNIAFAPGRDGNHPAQYAEQAVNGYRFTVTGLEEATHYAYNIDVKDAADKTIKSYTGEFTTESTTAVENTHSQSPIINCQKIIRDGQLYIYHNDKTYNTVGQIVE